MFTFQTWYMEMHSMQNRDQDSKEEIRSSSRTKQEKVDQGSTSRQQQFRGGKFQRGRGGGRGGGEGGGK